MIAVVAGTLAVVVLGGLVFYGRFSKEDAGIVACKAMRDDRETWMDSDGNNELTEEEYQAVRELLNDSRFADIREHGTSVVDLIWQMSKIPDDEAAGHLVGRIADRALELQTACAEQGIVVNLMDN